MAEPIRLGLILDRDDIAKHEERMRDTDAMAKQKKFIDDARRVYATHKF